MIKPLRIAVLAAAALLGVAAINGNWITHVSLEDGAHRIGNPEAKVKLIEFVSYTCPHCAHFARDGDGVLQLGYVGPGRISVDVRHIIRDPVDLTAAVLANCGAPAKFPRNHAALMLSQDKWLPKATSASKAQQQRWYTGDGASRRRAIASDLDFYEIMENRGYRRTDVDRCLGDEALAKRLAENSARDAQKWNVAATPSFAIDDVLLAGTHSWATLAPQLAARF